MRGDSARQGCREVSMSGPTVLRESVPAPDAFLTSREKSFLTSATHLAKTPFHYLTYLSYLSSLSSLSSGSEPTDPPDPPEGCARG